MILTSKHELLIGLISDTHVPSRAAQIPRFILDDFKEKKVDLVFHMGDFCTAKIYHDLQSEFGSTNIIAVLGNMDDSDLRSILPETRQFELFGHKIFMTHGTGGPNIIIKRLNKSHDLDPYEIIIFGHVHRPYNEIWKDGKLYLSPGTPTDKKFTDINSYGYLKISSEKIEPQIIYI